MSDDTQLVPLGQRLVLFYDDAIPLVVVQEGERERGYVPIRPICDYLSLSPAGQRERVNRDEVMAESARQLPVVRPAEQGGTQVMMCIPLNYLPGWLFGISERRVKNEETRETIKRYKRECHDVLWEAFQSGRLTNNDVALSDSPAATAYQLAMAVAELARHQMLIEARVDSAEARLSTAEVRIEQVEAALGHSERFVSAEQASQISEGVKLVAHVLGQNSGRNEYGGVYGELYRRFGITTYKQLPAAKFLEARNFLAQWYTSLTDHDAPF